MSFVDGYSHFVMGVTLTRQLDGVYPGPTRNLLYVGSGLKIKTLAPVARKACTLASNRASKSVAFASTSSFFPIGYALPSRITNLGFNVFAYRSMECRQTLHVATVIDP